MTSVRLSHLFRVTGMLLGMLLGAQAFALDSTLHAGEAIYRDGVLPSGQPLLAQREGSPSLSGSAAACSNCHRRSGLGEIDGNIKIPPISGPYLYSPRAASRADLIVPYVESMRVDRDPYTADTLARAIREGVGVDGSPLNYLMPRYSLSDADFGVLVDYLKRMRPFKTPGVTGAVANFATIVTPDADPAKRQAMLTVLDQYFTDQNTFALAQRPNASRSEAAMSIAKRRWQLHVWTLTGAPNSWEDQLRAHLAREPVYAAISGLGGKDWSPVHRFCEKAALPCIFPNVDLPQVAEQDVYSLYYTRGVLLEADLLALELMQKKDSTASRRVVQIFRADDVGEEGAKALRAALTASEIATLERPLNRAGPKQLAEFLRSAKPSDALVLWLRPTDIAALADIPVRAAPVFISGLMGGLDRAPVPAAWRPAVRMAYPAELPDKRTITVDYGLGWLAHHRIAVQDERVQVDTYVACNITMETLSRMSGAFSPDYLVERLEGMLEHQIVSGYYPRLALAPHERFASKGGYIVRFAKPSGVGLVPDTDWHVPP